jgi:homoprotocatechuate degradation regulator HpaR
MSHFRPILNHFGLSEQQWRILRALDEHGQLEPWELCQQCQMLSASMAGVLGRMEEMELIERSRVATDQRRVLVRLAKKGDRLIDQMAPLIELQYQHIERAFGKPVIDKLFNVLEGFCAEKKSVQRIELPATAFIMAPTMASAAAPGVAGAGAGACPGPQSAEKPAPG